MSVVSEYIASLGGYETAKDKSTPWLLNHGENWRNVKEATLLEYRRENNIYEVGDKYVMLKIGHMELLTVEEGDLDQPYWNTRIIRHATDAEIEANRWLDL